ncbi:MAG: long-chain-acyl-CoA synthetase [Acidimicrobiia bacterium]|nr:long-chain-acyl-CoA synthetase [Acidimicrobiia bacterium]
MDLPHRLASNLRLVGAFGRAAPGLLKALPARGLTTADVIGSVAKRHPERPALVTDHETVTYGELDARSNQVARWAIGQGIDRGDVVGLLMGNRPDYVICWLGLAKIGAVTALLNTHLVGVSLAHCIDVASAGTLIVDAELADRWLGARDALGSTPAVWAYDGVVNDASSFDEAVEDQSSAPLPSDVRQGLATTDRLFYIYTSGTTGLPKAANFSHQRFIAAAEGAKALTRLGADDRMYIALPLYHSAGGVMALGGALVAGATAVIAQKFSASGFWDDCATHRVTAFQYIGELCRYLANSPPHPRERDHCIRICVGNGLRPDVWERFQQRFDIPRIIEFYGATEGNVTLVNVDNKVGRVGRMPLLMRWAAGLHLVRYDVEADQVARGPDGFCVEAGVDEVGEAIARITSTLPFEGYTDAAATEDKVLRDVFRRGDAYFRTGDLLSRDADDWFTFVDRVGDTFRWKGENVATSEVAEVLAGTSGVVDATAYGVTVGGYDGRAGMAALVVDDDLDMAELHASVTAQLPAYAQPLFVRIRPVLETTSTFKHRKVDLVADGYDPARVDEPLYFLDRDAAAYVALDQSLHAEIEAGSRRL